MSDRIMVIDDKDDNRNTVKAFLAMAMGMACSIESPALRSMGLPFSMPKIKQKRWSSPHQGEKEKTRRRKLLEKQKVKECKL